MSRKGRKLGEVKASESAARSFQQVALSDELQQALQDPPEEIQVLQQMAEEADLGQRLVNFLIGVEQSSVEFIEAFKTRGMSAQESQMKSIRDIGRAVAKHMRDRAIHEKLS